MENRQAAAFCQSLLQSAIYAIQSLKRYFHAIDIERRVSVAARNNRRQHTAFGHFDFEFRRNGRNFAVGAGGRCRRCKEAGVIARDLDREDRRQSRVSRRRNPKLQLCGLRSTGLTELGNQGPTQPVAAVRTCDDDTDDKQ